jgi:hypothetical protein
MKRKIDLSSFSYRHEYCYTVRVRQKEGWKEETIKAKNIFEVAEKLGKKLDDVVYVGKEKLT